MAIGTSIGTLEQHENSIQLWYLSGETVPLRFVVQGYD